MKIAYDKPDLELVSFNILALGNSKETETEDPIPETIKPFDPDADFD
ncbi:MAG: hypothetical protein KBS62_00540 [Oscillospiraceae bacterium]|nr:hypothetical protein [Candidatus Ruminococcus equi]